MRSDVLALRDALVAVLRADGATSTGDLAEKMPWHHVEVACHCRHDYPWPHNQFRLIECRGTHDVVGRARFVTEIYRNLRALEDDGLVRRVWMPGQTSACWQTVHDETAAIEIRALEALWST
jgi:hypothetical protein